MYLKLSVSLQKSTADYLLVSIQIQKSRDIHPNNVLAKHSSCPASPTKNSKSSSQIRMPREDLSLRRLHGQIPTIIASSILSRIQFRQTLLGGHWLLDPKPWKSGGWHDRGSPLPKSVFMARLSRRRKMPTKILLHRRVKIRRTVIHCLA